MNGKLKLAGVILLLLFAQLGLAVPLSKGTASKVQHDQGGSGQPVKQTQATASCINGVAGGYGCSNVDLLSNLALTDIGGGQGADSWGWKDATSGRYFALIGRSNGTAFVEVTDPKHPLYLGNLPSYRNQVSSWRDLKTYKNFLYIVADSISDHGIQIFNLNKLLNANPGTTFKANARYTGIGSAHNIAINTDSGFAYVVGASGAKGCAGGLHMLDLSKPKQPKFVGCFDADGYTHDVQCVNYHGPDPQYSAHEICVASNEDTATIVDVTNKQNPLMLARMAYPAVGYSHQGWLSADQRYFFLGDELDELDFGMNTRTLMFDLSDLSQPTFIGSHNGSASAIDHNLYVKGNYLYQSNYTSGLRILAIENPARHQLREVAYFDTHPGGDDLDFDGAWNVYPFFDNGMVLVSDISRGMFMLQPHLQEKTTGLLDGRMAGSWIISSQQDQGLILGIGKNNQGPFAFYTWFTYMNGEPYWVLGSSPIPAAANEVTMSALEFSGLGFLDNSGMRANSNSLGDLHLKVLSCDQIEVSYDFGSLGAATFVMDRLSGTEGYTCDDDRRNLD